MSRPCRGWCAATSTAGCDELDFLEWDSDQDADGVVADRTMSPDRYVMLHPDAGLSNAERRQLIDALTAMERTADDEKCD